MDPRVLEGAAVTALTPAVHTAAVSIPLPRTSYYLCSLVFLKCEEQMSDIILNTVTEPRDSNGISELSPIQLIL